MELSYSHRFIFIHVYRAGGQSVSAALAPYAYVPREYFPRVPVVRKLMGDAKMRRLRAHYWGHIKAKELKAELPPEVFEPFFKFAFVRNPWDWHVSNFHYISQRADHPWHEVVAPFRDLEEYLDWRIQEKGAEQQSEFVYGEDGALLVDFVGRFERLAEDFAVVCERIGIASSLPHANRSSHADFRQYYTPATRKLVADLYREDIERFGYSFD
jgi:hypothetical protein